MILSKYLFSDFQCVGRPYFRRKLESGLNKLRGYKEEITENDPLYHLDPNKDY